MCAHDALSPKYPTHVANAPRHISLAHISHIHSCHVSHTHILHTAHHTYRMHTFIQNTHKYRLCHNHIHISHSHMAFLHFSYFPYTSHREHLHISYTCIPHTSSSDRPLVKPRRKLPNMVTYWDDFPSGESDTLVLTQDSCSPKYEGWIIEGDGEGPWRPRNRLVDLLKNNVVICNGVRDYIYFGCLIDGIQPCFTATPSLLGSLRWSCPCMFCIS